jgi:hydrogenase maturation protease
VTRVLVFGYGNPGRLDDGLGPALVEALAERGLAGEITLESGYQLQVEDAELVANHDVVVFVDAHTSCAPPFELHRLEARSETEFTTHALTPAAVLALAREHFGSHAAGYVLGIRGYAFDDFGERLSPLAQSNLAAAVQFVLQALRDGRIDVPAVAGNPEGDLHVRA